MKSPNSVYGHRDRYHAVNSTPDRVPYSPYSDASTVKKRNPLAAAARSFAGIFVACLTPPETTAPKNFGDSEEFKPPSGT
ncbi:hypothetical protein Tsubulata_042696 [Turnera subulata]|uniref:Uncharacterized protein n=1 Tax=Turnera subulata TaxID=218843 RepID=A0A9Q0FTL8_9ROSI|nr:hypothetical protein Tsubulata_042696 [Turnera subulata]